MSDVTVNRKNQTLTADYESAKAIIRKKVEFDNWDKKLNKCKLTLIEQEREYLKQFAQTVLINNLGLMNKIH